MTLDEAAELAEGEVVEYREGGVWRVGEVFRPMGERDTVGVVPTLHRAGYVREVDPIDLRR